MNLVRAGLNITGKNLICAICGEPAERYFDLTGVCWRCKSQDYLETG